MSDNREIRKPCIGRVATPSRYLQPVGKYVRDSGMKSVARPSKTLGEQTEASLERHHLVLDLRHVSLGDGALVTRLWRDASSITAAPHYTIRSVHPAPTTIQRGVVDSARPGWSARREVNVAANGGLQRTNKARMISRCSSRTGSHPSPGATKTRHADAAQGVRRCRQSNRTSLSSPHAPNYRTPLG